jgi:hypothetical protein
VDVKNFNQKVVGVEISPRVTAGDFSDDLKAIQQSKIIAN